ncbi:MAG TPA: alkaline phosphatase family protein, partial [Pirellulales bacterium]|nr:alkaline phosphatase family protein [Pirellulales bacterium]
MISTLRRFTTFFSRLSALPPAMIRGACTLATALCCAGTPLAAAPAEYVVMISVDGLPADVVNDPKASLPNLHALAARGVQAEGMRVCNPSVTWP